MICLSVLIIQSHDIFVHHHDLPHHHENTEHHEESGHNVFSFVDLDEEFTLQNNPDINNNFVTILSQNCFQIDVTNLKAVTLNLIKNEYPPPKPNLSFKSLRAPPINLYC